MVTGVSGAGKTTVGRALADRLGWRFVEGDDLHPPANVAKMRSGLPLDDDDRQPWLQALAAVLADSGSRGVPVVLTCSALKRSYRDVLRGSAPSVRFVHVRVPEAVLRERLARRQGHYMPAALLDSQLQALEPLQPDEPGTVVDGDAPGARVVDAVVQALDLHTAPALPPTP